MMDSLKRSGERQIQVFQKMRDAIGMLANQANQITEKLLPGIASLVVEKVEASTDDDQEQDQERLARAKEVEKISDGLGKVILCLSEAEAMCEWPVPTAG